MTSRSDTHEPNQGLVQVDDTGLVEGADAGFEQETGPGPDSGADPGRDWEPAATRSPATGHPRGYDLGRLLDGSDKGPVGGPPDSADAYGSGQDEGSID